MEGFKKSSKMQCFKEGGPVKYKSRHSEKSEMKDDVAQDKKIVKKAVKMHDDQLHGGETTDLKKLKKGGRAKKENGTVKKYEKASGEYGAKKDAADIKRIEDAKKFTPKKMCGGKSVKKMADGGQPDPYDIGRGALDTIGKVPMVGGALKRGATHMRDKVMGTPEQNRIAQAQMDRVKARKAAEEAALMGGMDGAAALQQGALAGGAAQAPMPPTAAMPMGQKRGGKAGKGCK